MTKGEAFREPGERYRCLDLEKTMHTIGILQQRVAERFPDSGLSKVCAELYVLARETRQRLARISRPNWWLRAGIGLLIAAGLLVLVYGFPFVNMTPGVFELGDFVQMVEAAMNAVVLVGAALIFLFTVEIRVKRSRTLSALHELRAIAHVIDMHQLTKDPSALRGAGLITPSSPVRTMTPYQLVRYLDYCSEMLALTGKVAAVFAQHFHDAAVLSAVNEIEGLTTGLSRKIWQKIMILHELEGDAAARGR